MSHVPPDPTRPQQRVRGEELRRRIELVRSQLLSGKSRRWVAKLVATEWGLKPSQCWNYIRKAEREIREIVERNKEDWLAEHVALRRDIRRRANDGADLRMELAAAESEARLLGLLDGKCESAPAGGDDDDAPVIVREVVIEFPAHECAGSAPEGRRQGETPGGAACASLPGMVVLGPSLRISSIPRLSVPYQAYVDFERNKLFSDLFKKEGVLRPQAEAILKEGDTKGWPKK